MCTTSDSPAQFLLARPGDGVLGFDGMGAIDFDKSSIELVFRVAGQKMTLWKQAKLGDERSVFMRRGVKPFDFLYDWESNSLLVAREIAEVYSSWFDTATSHGLSDVDCHFGKQTIQYLFGNLMHHDAKDHLVHWPSSVFHIANASSFDIYQSRIGRGVLPLEAEFRYTAENHTFSSEAEAREVTPSLHTIIPVKLALRCPPADLIQFAVGQTLISTRLFDAVWNRPRPKSRVAGLIASRPLVEIKFNSTS